MFSYKVIWMDGSSGELQRDLGLVAGSTYAQASAKLERYYGEEEIVSLELLTLEDSDAEDILRLTDVKHLADLFQKPNEEKFLGD